jgi:hypothetical protein
VSDFRKDKTGSAQTAANAAAVLVAAFADSFENFGAAVEAYNDTRESIFEGLAVVVDADNELFASVGSSNGSSKSSSRSSGSSSSRGSKTGGKGKSSGKSSISLDDALDMELNWGAFSGETLKAVLGFNAETCDEQFDYGDGERDGRDYISWLASDKNKNDFTQRRARLIADEEGIDYDD